MANKRSTTTLYIPTKDRDYIRRAIAARSQDLFGPEPNPKKPRLGSKYIMELVKKDLATVGLLSKTGEPNMIKIKDLETKIEEERSKPKY